MKRIVLFLAATVLFSPLFAQKATKKKKSKEVTHVIGTWTRGLQLYGGLTQVGNNNWYSTGSDKFFLTTNGTLDAWLKNSWKNKSWTVGLNAAYGMQNTTKHGPIKLNDRLELSTKMLIMPKQWKKWSWGPMVQLRTQFSNGYFYNYMDEPDVKRRRSGFFAPAFVYASPIGLNFKPNKAINIYMTPLMARWTIVTNQPYSYYAQGGVYKGNAENSLASLYNVSPVSQHRGEFGLFAKLNIQQDIMKNIQYKSKLEMFANYVNGYKTTLPGRFVNVDWFMTNQVEFKVNKVISVRYNLDIMYEDDMKQPNWNAIKLPTQSVGLQMLSTLGVGVKGMW